MTRVIFAVAITIACVSSAGAAQAQENPKLAREKFQEGTTAFDLGEFDKAIEAWQAGYKAKADPVFLYNIAQAYRLSGNHQRAVFFYKSYLRNAPRAANRADVEEKIDALQKVIDEQARTTKLPPPGPSTHMAADEPPPPTSGHGTAPPPSNENGSAIAPPPPPMGVVGPQQEITARPPAAAGARTIDLGVAAGVDVWAGGVSSQSTPSSLAIMLTGGYTLRALSTDVVETRLGAKIGFSFLDDGPNADVFLSILFDPMLRFHLVPDKLDLFGELGIGLLVMSGLDAGSVLFKPGPQNFSVDGALSTFELRPAVGVAYHVSPALSLTAAPGLVISTAPDPHFLDSIVRFELMAGASFRI